MFPHLLTFRALRYRQHLCARAYRQASSRAVIRPKHLNPQQVGRQILILTILSGTLLLLFPTTSLIASTDLPTRFPPVSIDLSTQASQTIFGAGASDVSGNNVSNAGDVNNDGFDDFLIGAPSADGPSNGRDGAGETYLIFGRAAPATTLDLATIGTLGVIIYGAQLGDHSASSVSSAGDVNNDGFDDFLIGADTADGPANGRSDAGEVYIIFGRTTFPATIDLGSLSTGGVTIYGINASDLAGLSANDAGDVNNDGFDDLIIGAYLADGPANGRSNAGESYIVFGRATFPATLDLATLSTGGVTIYGAEANDWSGTSVSSAGDVNNDGFDDLLIGAAFTDGPSNGRSDAGESYLISGRATFPATIDLAGFGTARIFYGADTLDNSGQAVSGVGDVNNDGFDDFLIGAFNANGPANGRARAGDNYLIFGRANLPTIFDLGSLGSGGTTIYGAEPGDQSGIDVSGAGDVNNDGFDDFLIGAFNADGPANGRVSAGDSYIIYGRPTFPATLSLSSLGALGTAIYGVQTMDQSGYALSGAGDVDADGSADILIGAWQADGPNNTRNFAGDSYLLLAQGPLDVELATFEAEVAGSDIAVLWETVSEVETLGFHLYRATSPDEVPVRLNQELITATFPGGNQGATYEWLDPTVQPEITYYYWLDDIDFNGVATRHGPVTATITVPTAVTLTSITITTHNSPTLLWFAGIGMTLLGFLRWRLLGRN